LKRAVLLGVLGAVGGFASGFSFAERLYATDAQKSSVRAITTAAAVGVAVTAVVGAVGVLRARAAA